MALCPLARWRGPVPNRTVGGMRRPILGLVLHIEQGTEEGTNAWFHNNRAEVSAHFGNPKSGGLDQWVDTIDKAWAEVSGNSRWISLENEGLSGQALTASQLENAAQVLAWLHQTEGVPLQITDNPDVPGLGWHGMGGVAWGGHFNCPGDPILAQRAQIVLRAQQILAQAPGDITAPTPSGEIGLFQSTHPTLQLGASGSAVEHLQTLLGNTVVDGTFSPGTESVVRAFQTRNGLQVDGVVGPDTWSKLHPAMQYGSIGAAVSEVQQALGVAKEDNFGPLTRDAVLNFQRHHGLTVDGIVGFITYRAMFR